MTDASPFPWHGALRIDYKNISQTISIAIYVATSTLSARDPSDLPELRAGLLVGLVSFTMRAAYEDMVGAAEVVRASGLDWTVVRLTVLKDRPKTESVRVGYLGRGEVGTWISRADVTGFSLSQTVDSKYLRQAPAIGNGDPSRRGSRSTVLVSEGSNLPQNGLK
jgi:hypothetical protein